MALLSTIQTKSACSIAPTVAYVMEPATCAATQEAGHQQMYSHGTHLSMRHFILNCCFAQVTIAMPAYLSELRQHTVFL